MSDTLPADAPPSDQILAWCQPLADGTCGIDLEYDADFLALMQAAAGTPETQFAPAEPPKWREVQPMAAALLDRTRDLRLAMIWVRAGLHLEGLATLPEGLALLGGMVRGLWDAGLHPGLDPDDGDAFPRVAPLANLERLEGTIGDVRQSLVLTDRRLGGLRVREIEIALGRLSPRADESTRSEDVLRTMLGELPDCSAALRDVLARAAFRLTDLKAALGERLPGDQIVDLKPLQQVLHALRNVVPAAEQDGAGEASDTTGDPVQDDSGALPPADLPVAAARVPGRIDSRKDAIRAIESVCEFLDRQEPTNPAQLLLRRAVQLMERDFLQLMRELAPDALRDVARIMGVDPDTIE